MNRDSARALGHLFPGGVYNEAKVRDKAVITHEAQMPRIPHLAQDDDSRFTIRDSRFTIYLHHLPLKDLPLAQRFAFSLRLMPSQLGEINPS